MTQTAHGHSFWRQARGRSVHSFGAPVGEITTQKGLTAKVFCFVFCDGATRRAASEACIPAACEGGEPGAEQMQRNSARLETRRRGAEARRGKSSSALSLCISVTLGTLAREAGVKAPRGGGAKQRGGQERGALILEPALPLHTEEGRKEGQESDHVFAGTNNITSLRKWLRQFQPEPRSVSAGLTWHPVQDQQPKQAGLSGWCGKVQPRLRSTFSLRKPDSHLQIPSYKHSEDTYVSSMTTRNNSWLSLRSYCLSNS